MIKKSEEIYEKIKEKSDEIRKIQERQNKIGEYKNLINYFTENMKYPNIYRHDSISEECCSVQIEDRLMIQAYVYDEEEKAIRSLTQKCDEKAIEWGILIHDKCIALINSDIMVGDDAYKNNKIVFKIEYSRPTDKPFLKYFTYDNLLRKRNTYYFRDIIMYRNTEYSNKEKCWHLYLSALRRFMDYMVEHNFNYSDNIYSQIKLAYLESYILDTGTVKSDRTVKNYFFYVKDFMVRRASPSEFNCSANVLCKRLKELTSKYISSTVDIYKEPDKIKELIRIVRKNQNAQRNELLILLMLSYGMERGLLCNLQWNVHFRKNNNGKKQILINENWYSIPSKLEEKLEKAENEKEPGADVWNVIDTNHMIVNAVLNAKYQEAQESGIGVTIKINDLSGWRMAYNDVTILLANLLDNAIEACKLCEDKKHIWFKCVQESGKIILSVKNTYCEMNRKKKEGLHGIGLKNVEHVITSYGGNYSIKKIQGKFIVTILFWMEE